MYGVFNIELNEFISIFIYINIVKNKKKNCERVRYLIF